MLALWAAVNSTIEAPLELDVYIHYQHEYQPWALSLMTEYLVQGLPAWRVESACALHLPLP